MTLPPEPPSQPPQGQQPVADPARASTSLRVGASQGQIMRCRRCEQDLPAGAMFCPHCGTPIETLCGSCRTANTPGSKFCMHCGQALDAPPAASIASSAIQSQTQTVTSPPQTDTDAAPAASAQTESQSSTPLPGSALPVQDTSATTPSAANDAAPSGAIACPRCRKVNEQAARYCYSCGLPLDEKRKPELSTNPPVQEHTRYTIPASVGSRFGALILDGIVVFGLLIGVFIGWSLVNKDFAAQLSDAESQADNTTVIYLFYFLVSAAYNSLMLTAWGATLGKRALGIRVVDRQGYRPSFGRSLGRYFASCIPFGNFVAIFRSDKRALHDLIADTWVVKK